MEEVIKMDSSVGIELSNEKGGVVQVAENMLAEARTHIDSKNSISVPITELATLGAGVSSLIPSLRTITQTTTMNTNGLGLYRLANAAVGDTLKVAKNGNFWGSLKTSTGKSKFAQFTEVGPLSETNTTVMPIDPATMMMAVALFSIEKQLREITEIQKQILGFLEREKKAKIEADVETLVNMIDKYKFNWDNERFITNNHKLVLDIQRTARKNMNAYQKEVAEITSSKQSFSIQSQVNSKLTKLKDKFNYYRLSLYTYSLASLLEVMLSGNFKEEYISGIRNELTSLSSTYRTMFDDASICIEKLSGASLETNILKGVGSATKGVGNLIGSIPFLKEGAVDEFLQDGGKTLKGSAKKIERKSVEKFAANSNPGITGITRQMDDMIRIYNHTSQIYFDDKQIYLIAK